MKSAKAQDRETVDKARKLGALPPLAAMLLVAVLIVAALSLAGPHVGAGLMALLALVGFGVLVTLILGWVGWRIVQIYMEIPKRKPVDISHLYTPPSPQVQPIVKALAELGFKRLGETRTQFSFGEPGITWILADPQATVVAQVVEGAPSAMLLFDTIYDDEAVVETAYPAGERIKTAAFVSQTVTTSVQDAYEYHLERVAEFCAEHGSSHHIEHMASFFRYSAVYRLRYGRRRLRRFLWEGIVHLAALGYSLVILLAFIALFLTRPSSEIVVQRYWSMIGQLTLATVISGFVFVAIQPLRGAGKGSKEAHEVPPNYSRQSRP